MTSTWVWPKLHMRLAPKCVSDDRDMHQALLCTVYEQAVTCDISDVLISSGGSSSSSVFPYTKMKGQLEDAVKEIGFDHVVILRPGLLVGERAAHDVRAPEYAFRKL